MPRPASVTGGRTPLAFVLPALAGLVVLGLLIGTIGGRESQAPTPVPTSSPTAVVAGQPEGTIVPIETPAQSHTPLPSPSPTDEPIDEPTPAPTSAQAATGGFAVDVVVCRSVNGSRCNGTFETLPNGARSFWLLVHFENSRRGDVIGTRLTGPGGTIDTPDFTVGGGEGYAWAQVAAGNLKSGEYTLIAERNGERAAKTIFTVR